MQDRRPTDITERKPGWKGRLQLQPWAVHKELHSVCRANDLAGQADEAPWFLDAGQTQQLERQTRRRVAKELLRTDKRPFDYGCGLSMQMPAFFLLRNQLRLVSVGDSRTQAGVMARSFYGSANLETPIALNMGVESTSLHFQRNLAEHYFRHCPRLEWVVYGASPRVLNRHWGSGKLGSLQRSAGWKYDRNHDDTLWEGEVETPISAGRLGAMLADLGEGKDVTLWGRTTDGQNRTAGNPRGIAGRFRAVRYDFAHERWLELRHLAEKLAAQGVRLMIFTPPIHPASGKTPAVDDDGTGRADNERFVKELRELAGQLNNVYVLDVNRGGRHDIPAKGYKDGDHLNKFGAEALTAKLEAFRRRLDRTAPKIRPKRWARLADGPAPEPEATSLGKVPYRWVKLKAGQKRYVDRDHKWKQVPDELDGALLCQTANDHKTVAADQSWQIRLTKPCRVYLLWQEGEPMPEWTRDWWRTDLTVDDRRVYRRDLTAGRLRLGGPGNAREMYHVVLRPIGR